jgi:ketosteroid isomerase-like protein
MKKFPLLLILIIAGFRLYAQQEEVESTIRSLEQREVKAVLAKDTAALRKMWAADFTVNSPMNSIQAAGKNTLDRPVMTRMAYQEFERNIEQILVRGEMVITMGNERVVVKANDGQAGRTIKRRYTNIWMKQNNVWQLTARHANEICQ